MEEQISIVFLNLDGKAITVNSKKSDSIHNIMIQENLYNSQNCIYMFYFKGRKVNQFLSLASINAQNGDNIIILPVKKKNKSNSQLQKDKVYQLEKHESILFKEALRVSDVQFYGKMGIITCIVVHHERICT